jgi:signal transduction histidine kinase
MAHFIPTLNAFIEDTCVLVVIAYLLARGRMLGLLVGDTQGRNGILAGLLLGLVGCTEVVFPGLRSPYVLHTLIVSFATLLGGVRTGMVAVATVLLGVMLLQPPSILLLTGLALTASVLASALVRRMVGRPNGLPTSLLAGMAAQACVLLVQHLSFQLSGNGTGSTPFRSLPLHFALAGIPANSLGVLLAGIPANGFGVLLLRLVVRDAQTRADSERHRLEAERAHALAAEAQLGALRARVHPHFLFNTLNSIAALCGIAPDRAEHAISRLSLLMRCALQADTFAMQPLRDEIEYTRAYLEIEQYRFGARLQVAWHIEPECEQALVPPFALQTLVENAVGHGIAARPGVGHLRIQARRGHNHVLIAVQDDGIGMEEAQLRQVLTCTDGRMHGLQIVTQQLILLYSAHSRPRIFSKPDEGTLVAFCVPRQSGLPAPRKSIARSTDWEPKGGQAGAERPDCR